MTNCNIGDTVLIKCRGGQEFKVMFLGKTHVVCEDIYGKQHWIPNNLIIGKKKGA